MPSPAFGRPGGGVPSPQVFAGNAYPEPAQYFMPACIQGASWAVSQVGFGTLNFVPFNVPDALAISAADVFISNSYSASNAGSSRADTLTASVAVYAAAGSSLSLLGSGSQSYAFTVTGSSSSVSYNGLKNVTVPFNYDLAPGNYWYVMGFSQSTAGNAIANASISNVIASNAGNASTYVGQFGQSSNASNQVEYGLGRYSATSSAFPAAVGFSELVGTAYGGTARPVIAFKNYTA